MVKRLFIAMLVVLMMASVAGAVQIGKVTVPDSMKAGDQQLLLNGAAPTTKMGMKIYGVGLYLKAKSQDSQAILAADEPMAIKLVMIYKALKGPQLAEAYVDIFEDMEVDTEAMKAEIEAFNAAFAGEKLTTNDVIDYVYIPGQGTNVSIKGKLKGTMKGLAFKKALFGVFIHKDAFEAKRRKALLGM